MAVDQAVADRVRAALADVGPVREVRMFGGLVFMVRSHMCCGVMDDLVFVRLGPEGVRHAVASGEALVFPPTGRRVTSMATIPDAAALGASALRPWIGRAAAYVRAPPARN